MCIRSCYSYVRIVLFYLFSSRGTHKLITNILCYTIKCIFVHLTKTISRVLTHSHRAVAVVLAVVIFLFDNLREKRSMPLTK